MILSDSLVLPKMKALILQIVERIDKFVSSISDIALSWVSRLSDVGSTGAEAAGGLIPPESNKLNFPHSRLSTPGLVVPLISGSPANVISRALQVKNMVIWSFSVPVFAITDTTAGSTLCVDGNLLERQRRKCRVALCLSSVR